MLKHRRRKPKVFGGRLNLPEGFFYNSHKRPLRKKAKAVFDGIMGYPFLLNSDKVLKKLIFYDRMLNF